MRERDQRRSRHSPFERDGQVEHDHDQEGDQRFERFLRDLAAPARPDSLQAHLVAGQVGELGQRAEHVELGGVRVQHRGPHAPAVAVNRLDDGRVRSARADRRAGDLRLGQVHRRRGGELIDVAALEVDAEVQAAKDQRGDADHQDHAGDRVPQLLPSDEVEGDLAAVQPPADIAEPRHHASFGVVRAEALALPVAGRAVTGREPRHGDRAPSLAGSSPDSGLPEL